MELHSPYLQAIQRIPGTVPGEKYKELNFIARRIVASTEACGDSAEISQLSDVPEPLLPLVQLKIANILHESNGVVEALKSEDREVVNKALLMRWFFNNNKEIIGVEYFEKNLLPYISVHTRILLIKRLSKSLMNSGETEIAEKFYTLFARKYSREQAEPLLVACSESFIIDTVTTNNIMLSCRSVQILFLRSPEIVIRYLKLSKPKAKWPSHCYVVNIYLYKDFLPTLLKNHPSVFVELLEIRGSRLGIKLSNKATERFLKSSVDALLDKPWIYVKLMPLKLVAAKLTKTQYKRMFTKLLPKPMQQFHYEVVRKYLEYYPEQERMSLVIDSYREAYGANFLDNTDVLSKEFMCMLPADERARQARIMLAKEPDWRTALAWRNYLPIEESIPSIKTEISKTSDPNDRTALLRQMFYSCKVNDDKVALLEALRYFTTRHKNELASLLFEVLDNLTNFFDLSTVDKDHWNVLNDFIQFLHVKDELIKNPEISKKILVAGIHFNLIHDLPIEDKIAIILEINVKVWNQSWNLLKEHPKYERHCLEMFLSMIPVKYPKNDETWKSYQLEVTQRIMRSIYKFNTRNAKPNCEFEKLTIKSYPWLLEAVKNILERKDIKHCKWPVNEIISMLRTHEKDLYDEWIVEEGTVLISVETVVSVKTGEALKLLAKEPKKILDDWEEYLKQSRDCASSMNSYTRRFIKATRWHQEIPIKFTDRCIKDVVDNQDADSVVILGILMRGDEFARFIEPFLPKESKIKTDDEEAKAKYRVIRNIPRAMNLTNPPVPLSLILSFCDGDYLSLGLESLTNICRRVTLAKLESFTKILVDRRVSVRKHGIRMFDHAASMEDIRIFLTNLWKTENHPSIRAVVFDKLLRLIVSEPNADTWMIMKSLLDDLKVDEDDRLEKLVHFHDIPSQYCADYVKLLLETLEKLEASGLSAELTVRHITYILNSIDNDRIKLMPEDFCEELLRKYFCNPSLNIDISSAGNAYAINAYLRSEEKLESRLAVLSSIFEDKLKRHWNVPHPKNSTFFPINYLAHAFMTHRRILRGDVKIMKSILKSFLAVLRPQCDFIAYAFLTYGIALEGVTKPAEFINKIVETLPMLVKTFSPEIGSLVAAVVQEWIMIRIESYQRDNVKQCLMESLCNIGTDPACFLAANILLISDNRLFKDRRNKIIAILRESKNPNIASVAYLHANNNTIEN